MPQYFDAAGDEVDAGVATLTNGRCKPGYREVLGDGEYARHSLMQCDVGTGLSVFITDAGSHTTDEDAARAEYERAQARRAQRTRDAWRTPFGGSSPPSAPQRTNDAEADFVSVQARRSEERRNAWKGGR